MLRITRSRIPVFAGWVGASMRPQRDAADNRLGVWWLRAVFRASMRPQRDAADNDHNLSKISSPNTASMRPQRDAADNALLLHHRE